MGWKRVVSITGMSALTLACGGLGALVPCPSTDNITPGEPCLLERQTCLLGDQEMGCGLNGYRCRDGRWEDMVMHCNPPPSALLRPSEQKP